ncbi:response regulator [Vibrio sp. SCSIO 43140]|uniref:response regulator n=1 Tax=Vibrio sp. SCSIO 43140 TaxID=2819100 RepID=UPI002074B24D|nr:response regulator [Vibrio sp. SCSIO 43140]USD63740.1 response regulator [Vibrio sp. SCSIO 43140]
MNKLELWNNLSVKHKMLLLVLLPLALIVFLASRQITSLNNQLADLEKVERLVRYSEVLSDVQSKANDARPTSDMADITSSLESLKVLGAEIFPSDEAVRLSGLLDDYQESVVSVAEAADYVEKQELVEWQVDTYKQILMIIEKSPAKAVLPVVDGHMVALSQLEWLVFWADEEIWQTSALIQSYQSGEATDELSKQEIANLVQNQQLFVERFVAINADPMQVNLLLDSFSNPAFEESSMFRNVLLSSEGVASLSSAEIKAGIDALNLRSNLIQGVSLSIEEQLRQEIRTLVAGFEQQRMGFLTVVSLLTVMLIVIGVNLALRVTRNLGLVLKFLEQEDDSQAISLTSKIGGKDELSRFAKEVERLTHERIEGEKRLLVAKEDAEQAKENAIQASKAKSSFLANMSHEIRTPLNGVIGISEVLSDTDLTATQKDYVDTIETSSHLLLSLINDILDFSKIESGMLQINPHSTSIRETIYDIASIVAPKVKEKGIELNVDIDSKVPFRVLADDHRMRQVLMNFMSNAVKFTEEGTVTIGVQYQGESENMANLLFEVKDSGIGIDKARQSKIFEAFAQEDDSTTRQFGGTGLGLAISTQLIELMGGKIQLDSVKGVGSRFYFTLSLAIDEHDYQHRNPLIYDELVMVCNSSVYEERIKRDLQFYGLTVDRVSQSLNELSLTDANTKTLLIYVDGGGVDSEEDSKRFAEINGQGTAICLIRQFDSANKDFGRNICALITYPLLGNRLLKSLEACCKSLAQGAVYASVGSKEIDNRIRVLLVEDNLVNQKVATLHLKKIGCEFDVANHGQEAVELYEKNQNYTFVLMDCMMPVMDGFEATEKIRQLETKLRIARTPIIALTASVVDDDIQKCFDSGMDDYVPKPFKAEILKEKIVSAIEMKQQELSGGVLEQTPDIQEIVVPKETVVEASGDSNKPSATESNGSRILLVEDNLVNQKVASLHLAKAGFEYDIAGNGQEALELYQSNVNYDVILMDCMMPVKDGFEATQDIREYEKQQGMSPTPIIALTASVVDDDIQKCFDAGMDAYVPKPVRREKLLHEMSNYL